MTLASRLKRMDYWPSESAAAFGSGLIADYGVAALAAEMLQLIRDYPPVTGAAFELISKPFHYFIDEVGKDFLNELANQGLVPTLTSLLNSPQVSCRQHLLNFVGKLETVDARPILDAYFEQTLIVRDPLMVRSFLTAYPYQGDRDPVCEHHLARLAHHPDWIFQWALVSCASPSTRRPSNWHLHRPQLLRELADAGWPAMRNEALFLAQRLVSLGDKYRSAKHEYPFVEGRPALTFEEMVENFSPGPGVHHHLVHDTDYSVEDLRGFMTSYEGQVDLHSVEGSAVFPSTGTKIGYINNVIFRRAMLKNVVQLDHPEPGLLPPNIDKVIIVCRYGVEAPHAAFRLRRLGFPCAYSVRGGWDAWDYGQKNSKWLGNPISQA